MKAIAYCRCSTEGQATDGQSLPYQEEQIRAWAKLKGISDIEVFQDAGISGFRMDTRPGLQAALAKCSKGDVFVVYSLSRFSRSVKDCMVQLDALAKRGVEFVSLSENLDGTTASGRAMIGVIAVFAQFFRDQISEHTKAALSHKRSKGERLGGRIPFGFYLGKDGLYLIEHETEQMALRNISEWRMKGKSLRWICGELDRQGIHTRTGVPWTAATVSKILKRK